MGLPSAQDVLDYIRLKFFKSAGPRELEGVKCEEQNVQCSDVTTGLEEECFHVVEPGPREPEEVKIEGLNVQCSDMTTGLEEECSHVIEPGPRELEEVKSEVLNVQCSGATTSLEEEYSHVIERGPHKTETRIGHGNSGNESTPSLKLQNVDIRLDCSEATLSSLREESLGAGAKRVLSAQDVLHSIAGKVLSCVNPSSPEELNSFLRYMEKVQKVTVVNVKTGSLIITAKCRSLEILDELWKAHCTGTLNKMAQSLVTEDVLKTFGLTEVKLITTIVEEEYEACREVFLKQGAGGYILWRLSHLFRRL